MPLTYYTHIMHELCACVRACVRKTQLTLKKPFYYEGTFIRKLLLNVPLSKNLAILKIAKIVKILRRISVFWF